MNQSATNPKKADLSKYEDRQEERYSDSGLSETPQERAWLQGYTSFLLKTGSAFTATAKSLLSYAPVGVRQRNFLLVFPAVFDLYFRYEGYQPCDIILYFRPMA